MTSRRADIELAFPDQERLFRLQIGQLRILQEKTGRGPAELLERIQSGRWYVDEIVEIIRQALLGGGAPAVEVDMLIKTYVLGRPWAESVPFAQVALAVAIVGQIGGDEIEDPPSQERAGETRTATEGSASPSSTAREPRSGGRRGKSTTSASGSSARP